MTIIKNLALSLWLATLLCPVFAQASTDTTGLRSLYNKPVAQWPRAELDAEVAQAELAPLPQTAAPKTPAELRKYQLGEQLFSDVILSADNTVSCASCHDAKLQFSDGRTTAVGVQGKTGNRNTPALFNLELWHSYFWDGRTATLKAQALQPISNPIEMALPIADAVHKLNASAHYKTLFTQVYNQPQIDSDQLADALAYFELQIKAPRTAYDQFLDAAYSGAPERSSSSTAVLNDQQLLGLHLFRTKARCLNCHQGALLSDNKFHVTGLHFYGRPFEDLGRYLETKVATDSGKFRTPSLRAVFHTGPWMHNGLFTQFEGIVAFYNNAGLKARQPKKALKADAAPFPEHSPLLQKLQLSKTEQKALTEFLKIL